MFSPDLRRLHVIGDCMRITLTDLATGKNVQLKCDFLLSHFTPVSIDCSKVVSGSNDDTVRVWSIEGRREVCRLEGHSREVTSVCFSPDGLYVVSGSYDKTVRIWDVSSGSEVCRLEGHSSAVMSVCFSFCGQYVVSGSSDKTVRVWHVSSGSEVCRLEGHSDWVCSVCFSPDGRYIVSGSWDNTVLIWSIEKQSSGSRGREVCRIRGHSDYIRSVGFSPDGNLVLSKDEDCNLKIHSKNGTHLLSIYGVFNYAFSPCGNYLLISNHSNTYRLICAKTFVHVFTDLKTFNNQWLDWNT